MEKVAQLTRLTDRTFLGQGSHHQFTTNRISRHIRSWKSHEFRKLFWAIDHGEIHDLGIAQNESGVARLGRRPFDQRFQESVLWGHQAPTTAGHVIHNFEALAYLLLIPVLLQKVASFSRLHWVSWRILFVALNNWSLKVCQSHHLSWKKEKEKKMDDNFLEGYKTIKGEL